MSDKHEIHVFKGHVIHSKQHFQKGNKCPDELVPHMLKLGCVTPLPKVVAPTEPEAPKAKG